jgi:hypothetical protein
VLSISFGSLRSSWLANDLRHVIVEGNYHEDPENTRNSFCEENIALFDVKEIVTHSCHFALMGYSVLELQMVR